MTVCTAVIKPHPDDIVVEHHVDASSGRSIESLFRIRIAHKLEPWFYTDSETVFLRAKMLGSKLQAVVWYRPIGDGLLDLVADYRGISSFERENSEKLDYARLMSEFLPQSPKRRTARTTE